MTLPQRRFRARYVMFVVIPAILVVCCVAGITLAHTPSGARPRVTYPVQPVKQGSSRPSSSGASEMTSQANSDPDNPQTGAHATSIGAATLSTLAAQTKSIVRLYASFPSKKGNNYLLTQLKPLVTTAALADIQKQWQGPTGGVYAQTTGNAVVIKTDAVSVDTVKVYTYISQSISASGASKNFHIFGAIVTFTEAGATWHVTVVSNDSQDYS